MTTIEGVDFTQGHMDADYVLTDGLKVNGISNLDGVQVHKGSIYAENDSYVGGVQLADGLVNGVDMDNLRGIERVDYGNGVGETTIEGATTFDQGGMGVYTDTGSSVVGGGRATFNDGESTTSIIGGAITAKTLNSKVIDDLVEGSDIADDLANVSGITRTDENNDGKLDTTTIEGSTSFDAKGMVVGDNAVVANADGSFSAANGAFGVSKDGAVRVQSSDLLINNGSKDESIAMTDGGLSLITTGDNGTGMVTLSNGTVSLRGGSTSTVTINGDGTTFGTLLGNETTNINGGTVTASNDFVTTNEDGTKNIR